MKKVFLTMIMILLVGVSFVSATTINGVEVPDFTVAVEENAPTTDVILATNVVGDLTKRGYRFDVGVSKLFGETDPQFKDNHVFLLIYYGEAIVIIDEEKPAGQLARDIYDILRSKGIKYKAMYNSAINMRPLVELFDAKQEETKTEPLVEHYVEEETGEEVEEILEEAAPEKIKPRTQEICSGCVYEGECVSFGMRLKNGHAVYCDIDGEIKEQMELGKPCQNSFECLSNQCMDGECYSLSELSNQMKKTQEEVRKSQNLMQKILTFFKSIFGKK